MRDIKFRAWNGIKYTYFDLGNIYGYEGEVCGVLLPDGVILNLESGYKTNEGGSLNKDLTIHQFTGLKDKNGVDIYMGDYFLIESVRWIVEWNADLCRYIITTGLGYDTRNCRDLTCDSIYFNEIIGNIHEK